MPTDVEAAVRKFRRKTLFVRLARVIPEGLEAHGGLSMDLRVAGAMQTSFMQDKLRDLLDHLVLYADQRHQYMAYALALDKSQGEMDFMVDLIREHQILRNRFEARGLSSEILDAIDALIIYRKGDR